MQETFIQQRIGEYKRGGVASTMMARQYKDGTDLVVEKPKRHYIIRRLTPLECCRLQGFPDGWGDVEKIEEATEEQRQHWEKMREAHANVTGKPYKRIKTTSQLISWLNKLHNDSAEYKMWGNGIALPCAVDVLWRIAERERNHEQSTNDGQ